MLRGIKSCFLSSMEKDAKWLAWAEQRFAQVAGEDRLIYLDEFKKALNVKKVSGRFRYLWSVSIVISLILL